MMSWTATIDPRTHVEMMPMFCAAAASGSYLPYPKWKRRSGGLPTLRIATRANSVMQRMRNPVPASSSRATESQATPTADETAKVSTAPTIDSRAAGASRLPHGGRTRRVGIYSITLKSAGAVTVRRR